MQGDEDTITQEQIEQFLPASSNVRTVSSEAIAAHVESAGIFCRAG